MKKPRASVGFVVCSLGLSLAVSVPHSGTTVAFVSRSAHHDGRPQERIVSPSSVLLSQWNHFQDPQPREPGELYDNLFDIVAIDSDDVWADGYYIKSPETQNRWQTLIEH